MSNGLVFYDEKFAKYNLIVDPLAVIAAFFYFAANKIFSENVAQTVEQIMRPFMGVGILAMFVFFVLWVGVDGKMFRYSIIRPNKRLIRITHIANIITFSAMLFFMETFAN